MYYFEILEVLKKNRGRFVSTVEIVQEIKRKKEINPYSVVRTLRKMNLRMEEIEVKRENFRLCYYRYKK